MTQTKSVQYDGKDYDVVQEGLAEILNLRKKDDPKAPQKKKNGEDGVTASAQSVFYNPIQQFNRDLSVLAIKVFSEDLAVIRRNRHERRLQAFTRKRKRNESDREQTEATEPGVTTRRAAHQARDDVMTPSSQKAFDHGKATDSGFDPARMLSLGAKGEDAKIENRLSRTAEAVSDQKPDGAEKTEANGVGTQDGDVVFEEPSATRHADPSLERQTSSMGKEPRLEKEAVNGRYSNPPGSTDPSLSARFRICDALSATGLRAIRYAKEIPLVTQITANDLSPAAISSIALNVRHNELGDKIIPTTSEAQVHLSASAGKPSSKYEVIDLDPYGTAAPFFDSALQALVDGGLLCVTCTDASLFASMGYLEKTFTLYRGLPFKGQQSHEVGLRLILNAVATSAASYGIAIEPLLSISADFYVRLFIRVRRVLSEAKHLGGKTMFLFNCGEGCGAFSTQPIIQVRERLNRTGEPTYKYTQAIAPTTSPTCEHCDYKLHLAGPMWGGPLHNPHFVQRILDILPDLDEKIYGTIPRIKGMLTLARDETFLPEHSDPQYAPSQQAFTIPEPSKLAIAPIPSITPSYIDPAPLFIHLPTLCKALHCNSPPDAAIRGALLGLDYRVSRSHTSTGSIKTDAPWSIIWEVMREWTRQKAPVKQGAITKGTAGWGLMKRDRGNIKVATMKEEVEAILRSKDGVEEIRDGIQAALYRATCEQIPENKNKDEMAGEDAEKADGPNPNGNVNNPTSQHVNGDDVSNPKTQPETAPATSATDPLTHAHPPPPRSREKKLRERNTYKHERRKTSPDGHSPRKPTMTHPGHQPLTALQRSELNVVFDEKLGAEAGVHGLVRYQVNPRENWGPMKRARGGGVRGHDIRA